MNHHSTVFNSKPFLLLPAIVVCALFASQAVAQNIAADVVLFDDVMWALSSNDEDVEWGIADQYCRDLDLAGYNDWRLPTLHELEARLDPGRDGDVAISSPLPQTTCCLWSANDLIDIPPEEGHFYIEGRVEPDEYAWGFLYSREGIRYYSAKFFPDGQALCVRDPD